MSRDVHPRKAVTGSIRDAVDKAVASGVTRYAIARDAEIDYATFARWLDEGRDIRASTIDKLAAHFGLVLVPATVPAKPKTSRKK
jgi:hypothetical protein